MSKKSRKKKNQEELPEETTPARDDSGENPEAEVAAEEAEAEVPGEITDAPEGGESPFPEGQADEIPESVSEEALHGSAPAGIAPPLPHVLEAILFASQKAVAPKELVSHLRSAATAEPESAAAAFVKIKEGEIHEALVTLQAEVAASGRAYQVRETATGWILSSAPGYAPWLRALYPEAKPTRLSASALETLAIIAYRQPITRADMEAVRGVSVDGVMQTLLDRGLVKIAGRAEVAGRPLLYATTQYFLDHFGLRHLDELPNAAELRHVPLPSATPAPEENPAEGGETRAGELPGISGEESAIGEEQPAPLETVEVTEIIEVRESVVFEEVVFDPEEPSEIAGDPEPASPSEGEPESDETR
jgi:segregation and condensation protein B